MEGKPIGSDTKKKKKVKGTWFGKAKCKLRSKVARFFVVFFFFFIVFFYLCCSNYVRMKNMLWIEDIVQNTIIPTVFTNFRVDMITFEDLHRWVARRNAFLTLSTA